MESKIIESSGSHSFQCYSSLLSFAEFFRTSNPPNIRLAIHCLKSIFYFKLPVHLEAKTHLQIGKLLLQYGESEELISFHLEKARELGVRLKPPYDNIRYEASEALADHLEKKDRHYEAVCVIKDSMRSSNTDPYWHCRSIFRLAHLHVQEGDTVTACELLENGSQFAQKHGSDYTKGLFTLSRCMLCLSSHQIDDANLIIDGFQKTLESIQCNSYQTEALRIFYLVLKVSSYLFNGRAKSAHPLLRQLHQSIQQFAAMDEYSNMTTDRDIDKFQWMPREYMVILVYLITVMQATQSGWLEKAQRSADKAIMQIDKLSVMDSNPLLKIFLLNVIEHTVIGKLVMGLKTNAVSEIGQACKICVTNPVLMKKRLPQLHTLIGLYAMSMNCMDYAEKHFSLALRLIKFGNNMIALRTANPNEALGIPLLQTLTFRDSLTILISLNLGLVYIRQSKINECEFLMNQLYKIGGQVLESCYCLKAAARYVKGFQAFCQNNFSDAKHFFKEALQLSTEEELNRLCASASITMGQIYFNEKNPEESQKMVSVAILAGNKLPDIGIQLWASALLKDIASILKNREEETRWFAEHERYSKSVIEDHMKATISPEHRLIEWFDGPFPDYSKSHPRI